MNTFNMNWRNIVLFACMALGLGMALNADAQNMQNPFVVAAARRIMDQSSEPLVGSMTLGSSGSCLVHLLWASNGIIYEPQWNGMPDERNPIIKTSYIGEFTSWDNDQPAMFATQLIEGDAIPSTAKFFVRVYNAPIISEATHYGDSPILQKGGSVVVLADVAATTRELRAPEPSSIDTDNDGMSDYYEETIAGTDPFDPDSVFTAQLDVAGGNSLTWMTIPGRWYVVERNLESLTSSAWEAIYTNQASGDFMEFTLTGPDMDATRGYYRLRVSPVPFE